MDVTRHRILNSNNLARASMVALAVLLATGCRSSVVLKVHFLPGFVPGTRDIFEPSKIAIAPPGDFPRTLQVGSVFDQNGELRQRLQVHDLSSTVADALAKGFSYAGLKARMVASVSPVNRPPDDSDFLMTFKVEQAEVMKRFGKEVTVHGRYFTMHSQLRIRVELFSGRGKIYSGKTAGVQHEPPAPVGGEVFFPLETDPAESLSVAMSKAVGNLVVELATKSILPKRGTPKSR